MERMLVSGVAADKNCAKISVVGLSDKPGTAFRLFDALSQANINVDMILQSVSHDNTQDIAFTVVGDYADDAIKVIATKELKSTQVTTLPYPGFPTDMQPQMTVVLGIAQGVSTVTESIWENRFKYVDELARMGAQIQIEGSVAIITGVDHYTGARVQAPDLRAGAALVIAGLAGDGITVVDDIYFIQRGYESFAEKLQGLGGQIEQTSSEREIQKFVLKVS